MVCFLFLRLRCEGTRIRHKRVFFHPKKKRILWSIPPPLHLTHDAATFSISQFATIATRTPSPLQSGLQLPPPKRYRRLPFARSSLFVLRIRCQPLFLSATPPRSHTYTYRPSSSSLITAAAAKLHGRQPAIVVFASHQSSPLSPTLTCTHWHVRGHAH